MLQPAIAWVGGCNNDITGATSATLSITPQFWSQLGAAIVGVTKATEATFAGSFPPLPPPPLCSRDTLGETGRIDAQIAVDHLTVVREPSASGALGFEFAFARRVVSASAQKVQAVAISLCGLPIVSNGPAVSCPAASRISYRLTFASPRGATYSTTIEARGCEAVAGAVPGSTLSAASRPRFWVTLGRAIGIGNPGHAAFIGTKAAA